MSSRAMAAESLERIALFALIALAVLRPLIGETYHSSADPIAEALQELSHPSPARTLLFNVIILSCATLWLLARAVGPASRFRTTGLELGLALIAIASVISCAVAGNKRIAINAAIDWLCMGMAAIVLVQLLRYDWQRRVLLAAVVAGAAVQAVQCIEQHATFDDTWAHYQSNKAQFWESQGVELDSGRVALFEQRIKAGEASGYFPHSNVAGAYLALCGLGALGLALQRWRSLARAKRSGNDRAPGDVIWASVFATIATFAITILLGIAIWLTRSLGAMIAAAAGVGLWVILGSARGWIRRNRRTAIIIGGLGTILVGLGIVGYGVAQDRLPGASLSFRWEYWKASAQMIGDHFWTGVGRENFGRHYLQYKPIHAPEEISNPHNLFVHTASELGIMGAIGLVVLLSGGILVICGPKQGGQDPVETELRMSSKRTSNLRPRSDMREGDSSSRSLLLWGAGLLAVVTVLRIPFLGTSDLNMVYYTTVMGGLVWAAAFAAFAWSVACAQRVGRPEAKGGSNNQQLGPDAPFPTAVALGLFAFLLHEMINFALFVPGSAFTFFVLAACVLSARHHSRTVLDKAGSFSRWAALIIGAVITVVVAAMVLRPVVSATQLVKKARVAVTLPPGASLEAHPAFQLYQAAASADPLDPTPRVENARWLAAVGEIAPSAAEAFHYAERELHEAIRRDPHDCSTRRLHRQILLSKAEWSNVPADFAAAIEAGNAVLRLYPLSPADIVALADIQLFAATATPSPDPPGTRRLLEDAISNFRRALDMDDQRPTWEIFRRFRESQRIEIFQRMDEAKTLLDPA